MIKNIFNKLLLIIGNFIFHNKYKVFTFSFLITITMFYFAKQIKLDPSLRSLLPENHQVLDVLDEANQIFGHSDNLLLVIRTKNFKAAHQYIDTIAPMIEKHPETQFVIYKVPFHFFEKNLLLYMDTQDIKNIYQRLEAKINYERRKKTVGSVLDLEDELVDPGLKYNDIINKYRKKYNISDSSKYETKYFHKYKTIKNKDLHTFIILIRPKQSSLNIKYSSQVVKDIQELIQTVEIKNFSSDLQVHFTGRYKKKPESLAALGNDFKNVTAIAGLGILLILLLYFRSFWPLFLVMFGLLNGLVWTIGAFQIIVGKLNLITTFLIAILLGLGIDFGIHYIIRFKEEISTGKSIQKAFMLMFQETGVASFIAALTTAIAFLGLYFSGFRAFSEFGLIASVGVLLILLSYMTLMTSLLLIIYNKFPVKANKTNILSKISTPFTWSPKVNLTLGAVFIVISIVSISRIEFDYNFSKVMGDANLPSYKLDKEISERFNRTFSSPSMIVPRNVQEEKKLLQKLQHSIKDRTQNNQTNYLDKVVGITSFIPNQQDIKLKEIAKLRTLFNKNKRYISKNKDTQKHTRIFEKSLYPEKIHIQDIPYIIRQNFMGQKEYEDRHKLLVYPNADLGDGKQILQFIQQLNHIKLDGKPIRLASDSLIFAEILNLIKDEGYLILIFTFFIVYLLASINFSSFPRGALVLFPVGIGLLWLLGIQGLLNIKMNFINIIIYPIIIGIGIDSGVHLYHRYQENSNLFITLKHTGESIILASLTTMVGFGSLALASNEVISSMGKLAIIGIITNYVACLFILPSIIMIKNKKRRLLSP